MFSKELQGSGVSCDLFDSCAESAVAVCRIMNPHLQGSPGLVGARRDPARRDPHCRHVSGHLHEHAVHLCHRPVLPLHAVHHEIRVSSASPSSPIPSSPSKTHLLSFSSTLPCGDKFLRSRETCLFRVPSNRASLCFLANPSLSLPHSCLQGVPVLCRLLHRVHPLHLLLPARVQGPARGGGVRGLPEALGKHTCTGSRQLLWALLQST